MRCNVSRGFLLVAVVLSAGCMKNDQRVRSTIELRVQLLAATAHADRTSDMRTLLDSESRAWLERHSVPEQENRLKLLMAMIRAESPFEASAIFVMEDKATVGLSKSGKSDFSIALRRENGVWAFDVMREFATYEQLQRHSIETLRKLEQRSPVMPPVER